MWQKFEGQCFWLFYILSYYLFLNFNFNFIEVYILRLESGTNVLGEVIPADLNLPYISFSFSYS